MDIKVIIDATSDASYIKRWPAIEFEQQAGLTSSDVKVKVGDTITYVSAFELKAAANALHL